MIKTLFANPTDVNITIVMINSIGHCLYLISNHSHELFDLIDTILKIPFNGNDKIAIALCDLCKSLVTVGSSWTRLIYGMLFREMMHLATPDEPTKSKEQIGRAICSF